MCGKRARAFWLLSALLLFALVSVSVGHAQPIAQPTSEPSLNDTNEALGTLLVNLSELKRLLKERAIALSEAKRQLARLENELTEAQRLLEISQARLSESKQEIERSTGLLRQSRETLDELRQSFEEYKMECEDQIRRRTIISALVGVGLGLLLGLLL